MDLITSSSLPYRSSQTQYVSPSDGMVSPCTAKLSAYRQKHFMKVKPQTLFGKGSSLANETKHTSVEEDMSDHAMEDTGDGHGARDSS
ncbi:MAG: hypothetical protein M1826_005499 [Phylliscum demangeonii]|nr:MAG: hypothetical protein M1826_005499 [Phylliscum demangeonii]